jgi:ribonucleoside-diphosphate reductase beta chain
MIKEIHDTLRTILTLSAVASRRIVYEPLGWTEAEVRMLFFQQLRRKLSDVGIDLAPDIEAMIAQVQPTLAGG